MTTEKPIVVPVEEDAKFQLTTTQRTLAYLSIAVIYFFIATISWLEFL